MASDSFRADTLPGPDWKSAVSPLGTLKNLRPLDIGCPFRYCTDGLWCLSGASLETAVLGRESGEIGRHARLRI